VDVGVTFGVGSCSARVLLYAALRAGTRKWRGIDGHKKREAGPTSRRAGSRTRLERALHEKARLGVLASLVAHPDG